MHSREKSQGALYSPNEGTDGFGIRCRSGRLGQIVEGQPRAVSHQSLGCAIGAAVEAGVISPPSLNRAPGWKIDVSRYFSSREDAVYWL